MPIARIVERHKVGVDDRPVGHPPEEPPPQEHLARAIDCSGETRGGMVPGVGRQAEHRQEGLHERGRVGLRMPVTIPAAVGPLPTEEPLDEGIRPPVCELQVRQESEGVPLLRGASAGPAPHHRHPFVAIRLGLRARHELAEVVRLEPAFENPVPDRMEGLVPSGIAEIREGGEDPVDALPLVVHLAGRPRSPEFVSSGEESPNARGGADLFLEFADRLRVSVFAEDVDASLPADGGFRRPQEAFDHGPRIGGPRRAARFLPPSSSGRRHTEGLDAETKNAFSWTGGGAKPTREALGCGIGLARQGRRTMVNMLTVRTFAFLRNDSLYGHVNIYAKAPGSSRGEFRFGKAVWG